MKWETMTLGELCKKHNGQIQTGPFGSQLHQSDYKEVGTPVVMPKDIINDKISTEGIARISDTDVARLSKHILKKGDIVFPRRGEINKRALITDESEGFICGTGCLKISINSEQVSNMFLNYYLARKESVDWLENNAVGSTMKNLSGQILSNIPIEMPPINTQRRIASILSAYDDLIENNLRRIKLLEEAAQHIYREWFVRMRFPGWEGAKFGEDGVPEGWRKVPVEEIIEYHIGGGWGNDDVSGDYVQPAFVIRGTDIPKLKTGSAESVPFRYHSVSNFKSRRLQENDLVFEVSGGSKGQPVGRSLLVTDKILELFKEHDIICASFCKLIRIDSYQVSPYYFDAYILEVYGNGVLSQYENQSASNIMNFKFTDFISKEYVVVPSQPIQKMFDKLVQPLKNQIGNLATQISRLKEARDILLPRLMNQTTEV